MLKEKHCAQVSYDVIKHVLCQKVVHFCFSKVSPDLSEQKSPRIASPSYQEWAMVHCFTYQDLMRSNENKWQIILQIVKNDLVHGLEISLSTNGIDGIESTGTGFIRLRPKSPFHTCQNHD